MKQRAWYAHLLPTVTVSNVGHNNKEASMYQQVPITSQRSEYTGSVWWPQRIVNPRREADKIRSAVTIKGLVSIRSNHSVAV